VTNEYQIYLWRIGRPQCRPMTKATTLYNVTWLVFGNCDPTIWTRFIRADDSREQNRPICQLFKIRWRVSMESRVWRCMEVEKTPKIFQKRSRQYNRLQMLFHTSLRCRHSGIAFGV